MEFRRILVPTDLSPNAVDAPIHCVTARGTTYSTIIEYALDNRADSMVVGLRGTGSGNRIRATLLGSVAEAMIRKSPCPVIVMRPVINSAGQ
jgi:nucleotide-binding universal stress UspA family protein